MNFTSLSTSSGTVAAALNDTGIEIKSAAGYGMFLDLTVTTATAQFIHEKLSPMYNYVRVVWAMTAGQVAYNVYTVIKQ